MDREATSPAVGELPERVRALFWEYDPDALGWESDRDLITERVLAEGDWPAVRWLRRQLGDAGLQAWLRARHGGPLSPRQLRFWQLVLDVPARAVDDWISDRQEAFWEQRRAR